MNGLTGEKPVDNQNTQTQKDTEMTTREWVLQQKPMGINEWIKAIEEAKYDLDQHTTIECANYYNMVIVDHSARFDSSLINL